MKGRKKMKNTVPIDKALIDPHPDNPRKDLGDLSELIESIRMNGILQNLTVVPQDDEWTRFTCLIGHRRLAASKQIAKITEVPCIIVEDLSRNEQIGIMLEENMQRNDLTIVEQAESFQMMLDLGETIETIGDKTGFSETTIRHRLQIAKLDPELLHDEDAYQFRLADYIKLEKVEDIEERNKILALAKSPQDIEWRVNSWVVDQARKRDREKIEKALTAAGIKKTNLRSYDTRVEKVKEFCIGEGIENVDIPESDEKLFWAEGFGSSISIVKIRKEEDKPKSEYELTRERIEANRKKLRAIQKEQEQIRKQFLKDMVSGRYTLPDKKEIEKIEIELWDMMMGSGEESLYPMPSLTSVTEHISGIDRYKGRTTDEWKEWQEKIRTKPMIQKLAVMDGAIGLSTGTSRAELIDYTGHRNAVAKIVKEFYGILERLGFKSDPEFIAILDGNSELFEEEKNEQV